MSRALKWVLGILLGVIVFLTLLAFIIPTVRGNSKARPTEPVLVEKVPLAKLLVVNSGKLVVCSGTTCTEQVLASKLNPLARPSGYLAVNVQPKFSYSTGRAEDGTRVVNWQTGKELPRVFDGPSTDHPAVGPQGREAYVINKREIHVVNKLSWIVTEGEITHLFYSNTGDLIITVKVTDRITAIWKWLDSDQTLNTFGIKGPQPVFTSTNEYRDLNGAEGNSQWGIIFSAASDQGEYDLYVMDYNANSSMSAEVRPVTQGLNAKSPALGPYGEVAFVSCLDPRPWDAGECEVRGVYWIENSSKGGQARLVMIGGDDPTWEYPDRLVYGIWQEPKTPTPTLTPTPAPTAVPPTATPVPYVAPQVWPTPTQMLTVYRISALNMHAGPTTAEWGAPQGAGPNGESCKEIPQGQQVEKLGEIFEGVIEYKGPEGSSKKFIPVRWGTCEGVVRPEYLK